MDSPKCRECSQPISETDLVVPSHGHLIHLSCWQMLSSRALVRDSKALIRKSRELLDGSAPWVPGNEKDANGWPICPTCKNPLRPGASAARQGAYMVHPGCWKAAAQ